MLPPKIHEKFAALNERRGELETQMLAQQAAAQWRSLSEEYGRLLPTTDVFQQWLAAKDKIEELQALVNDPELQTMAAEEIQTAQSECDKLEKQLIQLATAPKEDDNRDCFLEIRAAVGGNESQLFAGELFRMYCRYAELRGWNAEVVSRANGDVGGVREIIVRIGGENAYERLQYESGAHRVQRVPDTESQGRIHTSIATVAVMAEALPEEVQISPADLRVETFRSSGAGGQHVNTTDSAVRITHLPTGAVVECQDNRSQHKNKERALDVLRARVAEQQRREQQEKESAERKALVGGGFRSDRIRTYNFPQGRMTDHRIGLTLYKLPAVMEGDLDELLNALETGAREEA